MLVGLDCMVFIFNRAFKLVLKARGGLDLSSSAQCYE